MPADPLSTGCQDVVWLRGLDGLQSQGGVGEGTPGAHLSGHPDRLHDLLGGVALAKRQLGVALDAVWALGHVRDSYGDELLGFLGESAVGEDGLAERLERVMYSRSQRLALLGLGGCGGVVNALVHRFFLIDVWQLPDGWSGAGSCAGLSLRRR